MINILLPAISQLIALGVAMTLIGFLQQRNTDKMSTGYIAILLIVPFLLMRVVILMVGNHYFSMTTQVYPYAMSLYFFVPALILFFHRKKSAYYSGVYAAVIFASNFFAGAVLSFTFRALN